MNSIPFSASAIVIILFALFVLSSAIRKFFPYVNMNAALFSG